MGRICSSTSLTVIGVRAGRERVGARERARRNVGREAALAARVELGLRRFASFELLRIGHPARDLARLVRRLDELDLQGVACRTDEPDRVGCSDRQITGIEPGRTDHDRLLGRPLRSDRRGTALPRTPGQGGDPELYLGESGLGRSAARQRTAPAYNWVGALRFGKATSNVPAPCRVVVGRQRLLGAATRSRCRSASASSLSATQMFSQLNGQDVSGDPNQAAAACCGTSRRRRRTSPVSAPPSMSAFP